MLQRISRHSKQRICQRANGVSTFSESRKQAIQAFRSGQSIGDFQNFPEFFEYLRKVKERTSNSTTIRVYKGLIRSHIVFFLSSRQ